MRADRLMLILLILQQKGKTTTQELAQELEVSSRTILRDMDVLSGMGIPVIAERGKNGGWRLLDEYRKTLLTLKKEEMASLFLSFPEALLKDLRIDKPFQIARQKLFSALPSMVEPLVQKFWERIYIDTEPWKESNKRNDWIEPILLAVWEENQLQITYERADGQKKERVIKPLGLVARGNQWYLVAINEDNQIRSFKLNRVRSVTILDKRFERPIGFNMTTYWKQTKSEFVANLPRYIVQVELSPYTFQRIKWTDRFVRILDAGPPLSTGWIPATLRFDTEQEAAETILGFHSQVKVLSPTSLREKVKEMARAVLDFYERK
ncbi:helix-turn-helix transcriptional regulator [Thermoflavimicrobium daqui]|uniref:YafY family transcriptional regulator n=1 Tax=Thermoflavimicrobium daqui TaxID=2137476 RepID=A0A364K729_9BACL|nr:YafY family protein [Thermoflavimicrobium daqui]RAL26087.1 YafY family transcriptional regulator [Thermoflavimicrobium daqui]